MKAQPPCISTSSKVRNSGTEYSLNKLSSEARRPPSRARPGAAAPTRERLRPAMQDRPQMSPQFKAATASAVSFQWLLLPHITSHGRWRQEWFFKPPTRRGQTGKQQLPPPGENDSHRGAAQVLLLALALGARTSRSRDLRRVYHIDFRPLADRRRVQSYNNCSREN